MKNPLLTAVSWVGWSLRVSPGQGKYVSQVDGVSDMAPTCQLYGSVGKCLIKGTMASACPFSRRKLSPSFWLDTRHFSSSPYATGAFQAATLVLKLRGSESELIHVWVLCRKLLGTLEIFCTNLISAIFCSQKLWGLIFLVLEPVVGRPDVGLGLLTHMWVRIFIHHMWMWDQPIPHLHPSYQSGWMWFLYFHSCQTSIQLNFWRFWVMVLYFSCNFDVVVQGAVFTYATTLTKSLNQN